MLAFRALLLAIALVTLPCAGVVSATSACWASACVGSAEESWGEGSCGSGAAGSYRGLFVTYADAESQTGAYLSESCWSDGSDGSEGTSVALTRLEWASFRMDGVVVSWDSGHDAQSAWCTITLVVHAPEIGTIVPAPCPAGLPPPRVLPSLP